MREQSASKTSGPLPTRSPEEKVTLFDRIEFNPSMRWIDVMSDVGFLVMDLRDRGLHALAARLLSGYLETTGDYAGLHVLRFYTTRRFCAAGSATFCDPWRSACRCRLRSPPVPLLRTCYKTVSGGAWRPGRTPRRRPSTSWPTSRRPPNPCRQKNFETRRRSPES